MAIETIRMSSKGQVVIPQSIRKMIDADEGTLFAVTGAEDTVVLKKLNLPTKEELINQLSVIAKEGKRKLQEKGISESDLHSK
jgi:AbrB family looped-hinge helix DNA binding protein